MPAFFPLPNSSPPSLLSPVVAPAQPRPDPCSARAFIGWLQSSDFFALPSPPANSDADYPRQTFSLTIGGVAQHLISYYKIEDVEQGRLRSPSSLPELASLTISPEYLDKTHFRNPPKVEIGVDGIPRYRGEADDVELSPRLLPAPLSSGYYAESDAGPSKRQKGSRYDPYSPTSGSAKRSRKKNNSASSQQEATGGDSPTQPLAPPPQPTSTYSEQPSVPHYAPYTYYGTQGYSIPAHTYSPAHYQPPLPATGTTTPPQESPSPPPATAPASSSAYAYSAAEASGASSAPATYQPPPYYPSATTSTYQSYPSMHWPPYPGYQGTGAAAAGSNIPDITESDVRSSGGGGGAGGGGA